MIRATIAGASMSLKDHLFAALRNVSKESAKRADPVRFDSGGDGHDLLRKAQALGDELRRRAKLETLLKKHSDLIEKFLEIAERRISVLDDYGDKNWGALPTEIRKCLTKIAEREPSFDVSKVDPKLKIPRFLVEQMGGYAQPGARFAAKHLESKFRAYHETRRRSPATTQDISVLRGVQFETYLAKLLRENGFEGVAGTPATGDQGADLIAKKNGRTIAIQAKGCNGPVGNGAVQEIVGALRFYNADEGWVVTNSTFTPSARTLARANRVRLLDGDDLRDLPSLRNSL